MARKENPSPAVLQVAPNAALEHAGKAAAELALQNRQVADEFDDGFPFDLSRLIYKFRTSRDAAGRNLFDMGCALLVIKENVPHGQWTDLLEGPLDVHPRMARRLMSMAIKYQRGSKRDKLSVLGQTKLLELIDEPDDDLDALAEGGTLHGMELDELQCMTVRELRERLKKKEQREKSLEQILEQRNETIRDLREAAEGFTSGADAEREKAQTEALAKQGTESDLSIQKLVRLVDEIERTGPTASVRMEARHTIEWLAQRLTEACANAGLGGFDILGQPVEPGWRREQVALAQSAAVQMLDSKKKSPKR